MIQKTTATLAFLFWLAAFQISVDASDADYRPEVGKKHPALALPRIDTGEPVSLSDFRGRKVLLIHFASW